MKAPIGPTTHQTVAPAYTAPAEPQNAQQTLDSDGAIANPIERTGGPAVPPMQPALPTAERGEVPGAATHSTPPSWKGRF